MEITQTYDDFISEILTTRGRFNCDGYKERHHIKPKCLGGNNQEDNLIDLYAYEHYVAHKLLALEYPKHEGLVRAWVMMAFKKSTTQQRKYEISAEDYEILKKLWSKHMSEHNPGLKPDGHPWNYGVPMSVEQRHQISMRKLGVSKGPDSEETKLKKSIAAKNRYLLHPETFHPGNKGKITINNGIDIRYISPNDDLPKGWNYGNCKTSGHHDMSRYYQNKEMQHYNSKSKSGCNNSMYGNGYRVSGGKNGHATKWYQINDRYFDCRKDLVTYLNEQGISISVEAIRKIENKSYGNRTINKFRYVIDNLIWGYKNENKIN